MKTIRVTGIALSIVTLLLVAMAPPASAECPKLKGNYAFRLVPAKSFAADLVGVGDPANIAGVSSQPGAGRQIVLIVGTFTAAASGSGGSISVGDAYATTDGPALFSSATAGTLPSNWSDTWEVKFPFTGTYSCNTNGDQTGTLTITPTTGSCTCTDTTVSGGGACTSFTCSAVIESSMTFSISVSGTNGRVEMAETDNALTGTPPGHAYNSDTSATKIFLSGEAVKQ